MLAITLSRFRGKVVDRAHLKSGSDNAKITSENGKLASEGLQVADNLRSRLKASCCFSDESHVISSKGRLLAFLILSVNKRCM